MEAKSIARFVRIGARKARMVRDSVLRREANEAIHILDSVPRKAAGIVKKGIQSALANARQKSPETRAWYVKNLLIDEGPTMKRMRAAPMGRGVTIKKRFSHITVILDEELPGKGKKYGAKSKPDKS